MAESRRRTYVIVVDATTDDADFRDPEDLDEYATVLALGLARSVTSLHDVTTFCPTPPDLRDKAWWEEIGCCVDGAVRAAVPARTE